MQRMNTALGAVAMLAAAGVVSVASADVRVIHASPDAPPVDVYVNETPGIGSPAITGLEFTQSSGYVPLPTDTYNFQVTPANETSPVVIDATAGIDGNTDYTIAAINFLDNIEPLVLVDDNSFNPDAARIRFVHTSPDAPAVDIFAAGVPDALFSGVEFGESGGYIEVPGNTYDLEVRLSDTGALALEVPGVSVDNGSVYSIFAMGSVAGETLQAVPFLDAVIPAPGTIALLGMGGLLAIRRRRA